MKELARNMHPRPAKKKTCARTMENARITK
jgi:hypothetical protein